MCIVLLVVFLPSCDYGAVSTQPNGSAGMETNTRISTSEENGLTPRNELDPITNTWVLSEQQAAFVEKWKDNPIDADYRSEEVDSSTAALVERENRYAALWMRELSATCEQYQALLTEQDRLLFQKMQEDWLASGEAEKQLQQKVSSSEDYSILAGTIHSVEAASQYREAIRMRTFQIKYLRYFYENNSAKSSADRDEVIFYYTST